MIQSYCCPLENLHRFSSPAVRRTVAFLRPLRISPRGCGAYQQAGKQSYCGGFENHHFHFLLKRFIFSSGFVDMINKRAGADGFLFRSAFYVNSDLSFLFPFLSGGASPPDDATSGTRLLAPSLSPRRTRWACRLFQLNGKNGIMQRTDLDQLHDS